MARMVNVEYELWRSLCLSMPGAYEDFPFGEEFAVFKIAGSGRSKAKMFALLSVRSGVVSMNLKCDPVLAEQLRNANPQIKPGYHMSKKHWNTVTPGLDEAMMRDLIEDSYDLVVASLPLREREVLNWKGLAARG